MQRIRRRRTRDGLLAAVGAALTLIVLLVLQSFPSGGLLSQRTMTVTVTMASDAYDQVASAYENHLLQFDARDVASLGSGYESNATVEWTGDVMGMDGNYSGAANIKILFGSFIGKFLNLSLSNESQSLSVEGNVALVNSTFSFAGTSSLSGKLNGTVVAQDVYEHLGGSWLIGRETWNFTQFNGQIPIIVA